MFGVKMEEIYFKLIEESFIQICVLDIQVKFVFEQDNLNIKSNMMLLLNVFDKWRESRLEKVLDFYLMNLKKMSFWLE